MNILGLNYFFHDSTACIIVDGVMVTAIEEERLSRNKHTNAFPKLAINRCLETSGLKIEDIDHIAVSIKASHKWLTKLIYPLKNIKKAKTFYSHEFRETFRKQKKFWNWYRASWKSSSGKKPEVHFIEHHLAHVEGSFYVSPWDKAALLSLDGSGEWATSYLGAGEGNSVRCFNQSYFPNSLGSFYEAATQFCGFIPNYDEGKTMGLAPFGDPDVYFDTVDKIISIDTHGSITIDLSYFNYQFWEKQRCSKKFYDVFGPPRHPLKDFEKNHYDVAAAFQKVLEKKALELCSILKKKTDAEYLVIAGGVALNSVMNGRIIRESGFKDIYVMPAAGDNGTAIGAAFCLYNRILGQPRSFIHSDPYVGTQYTSEQIAALIKRYKLPAEYHENVTEITARLLKRGFIIGWFQGKMEIGPRALGNRSILANPAFKDMKSKINSEVKYREAYRPFAPSAPEEIKEQFFDLQVNDPFMLKVCNVLEDKQSILPAITHVDGSARLQTVDKTTNPLYHELIRRLGELTGVPVVLNTSFNIQGEPLVESPIDAIRCFYSTGLDVLVLGNYVIKK